MKSWFPAGSHPRDYEQGSDSSITSLEKNSGYLKAKVARPGGFGAVKQLFKADDYHNKRMRFSAVVKSEGVEGWAGLWMRVDGSKQGETLGFDNMHNRPIKGTTNWQKHEVVLDVPQESVSIAFGLLLEGKGQVWFSDVQFEEVQADVPTTSTEGDEELPDKLGYYRIIGQIVSDLLGGYCGYVGGYYLTLFLAQFFLNLPLWVIAIIAAAIFLATWAIWRFNARQTRHHGIIGKSGTNLIDRFLNVFALGFWLVPFGFLQVPLEVLLEQFLNVSSWATLIIAPAALVILSLSAYYGGYNIFIWAIQRFNAGQREDYPAKPGNLDLSEDGA